MHSAAIHARIEAADLPATVYRTARRLLDVAGEDGHVTLAKNVMLDLCGTDKWNTVRAHLGQLSRAGIIHYSTNAMVYVNFVIAERAQMTSERSSVTSERSNQPDAETSVIAERAQMTSERSQDAPVIAERSSVTSERAQMTSERSNEPSLGRLGKVGRLGTDQTTYLPTLDDLTDEQRRAVALLTDPDVGLVEASAIEHATAYSWTHILRMVANWYTDVQDGDVTGPGALHTRLQRNWTVGPITADFRRSDLCARHAPEETADQIDHTDRRRYQISAA
ncbi:MAG: hypothetical protein KDE20_13855 [Caldilineaceae bacterium]|nr:hypothetical protein [Caldilineaceae bacterium]